MEGKYIKKIYNKLRLLIPVIVCVVYSFVAAITGHTMLLTLSIGISAFIASHCILRPKKRPKILSSKAVNSILLVALVMMLLGLIA